MLAIIAFWFPVVLVSDMVSTQSEETFVSSTVSMPSLYVKAVVNQDGTIDVSETFEMKFLTNGLTEAIRYVPYVCYQYRDIDGKVEKSVCYAKISDASGTGGDFNVYVDEITGYLTFGLKDRSGFEKGETRTFTISYSYDIGKDRNKNFDDVYFNLVGTNSTCLINNVTFEVTFPDISEAKDLKVYKGKSGENNSQNFTISENTISGSFSRLNPGEGVTFRAVFADGYLTVAKAKINGYQIGMILLCLAGIAVAVVCFCVFRQKTNIPKPVELVPFEGLDPFVADFMANDQISTKTISASVIVLANKGYVKIEQKEKNEIVLHKTKKDIKTEKNSSLRTVYDALFKVDDESVKLSDLGETFFSATSSVQSAEKIKQKTNLYAQEKSKVHGILKVAYVLICVLSFVFMCCSQTKFFGHSTGVFAFINFMFAIFMLFPIVLLFFKPKKLWIINLIYSSLFVVLMSIVYVQKELTIIDPYCVCLISLFIISALPCFINVVPKYSDSGKVTKGRVLGFKNYIKMCEVEQIKMFAKENPNYYFDVLPYAYVFGLSDVWIEKFKSIEVEMPEWVYSDSDVLFDMLMFNVMFRNMNAGISNSISKARINMISNSPIFKSDGKGGGSSFGGSSFGGGFSGGGSGGGGFGAR